MSKTNEPTCNSPPMGVFPTAAGNLQDSFPAYFASPDRFADLLNNTLLQEHGEPPLDPRDLAPLDIHAGSYRFPAECWEQPTILMGVYYAGQPKTFGNLRAVFSLSCLSEPSGEEAVRQLRIVSSVRRWCMENSKDAEYQAALAQWETDAAAAKSRGKPIPQRPVRREKDGPDGRMDSCIPVVLYVGNIPWTAPTSLADLLKPDPGAGYGDLASPFRYHLIDPHQIRDRVFSRCSTDVGLLLKAIKHWDNAAMMDQFCRDPMLDDHFRTLCVAVGELISGPALQAARGLRDSFLAYFAHPAQFADLLNNTFVLENGVPPLDPRDLAPLDVRIGSYRFPIECWEQPTILMGVYQAGQPKTVGNLHTVFSLACLSEPSATEIARQGRISLSVDTWKREAAKDAEYQAALSRWEADAAAAKDRSEAVPLKPVRRVEDGPGDQGVTCVPMVLYAGAAPWTAPTSNKDTMQPGTAFDAFAITLFFHLLDPNSLPDSTFSLCGTDVGIVLKALKCQDNAATMDQLRRDPAFLKAGNDAIRFIEAATGMGVCKTDITFAGDDTTSQMAC